MEEEEEVEDEEEKTEEEKEEDVEEEEHAQICSHIKYFSIHLFYIVIFCHVLSYVCIGHPESIVWSRMCWSFYVLCFQRF